MAGNSSFIMRPFYVIKEIFFYKDYLYTTKEKKKDVLERMNILLDEQYDHIIDRGNSYISETDFKLYPPDAFLFRRWFEGKPVYARGVVESDPVDQTKVHLRIRPNSYYFVVFIFFCIMAIVYFIEFLLSKHAAALFGGVTILTILSLVITYLAQRDTRRFLAQFEEHMNLDRGITQ